MYTFQKWLCLEPYPCYFLSLSGFCPDTLFVLCLFLFMLSCVSMALSAMCFSIPSSFNLYHTLLLALVSVIAFTCSSCALLLIYWAPCPIVFTGLLSFSPLLSLPVDVAEYVFLSPCLVGLVSLSVLCPCLVICCSCLAPCFSILAVLAFCFFIFI